MTIDMNRFRQVTGTQQEPAPAAPASPYEGRSFAELMMQDIPKWNSAMKLSIAKGDLAGARQYNDLIEGASERYKDDWMAFTQFRGNHPVGALMRDQSMALLRGDMGVNVLNEALASKEVQGRAIEAKWGPGTVSQLFKASIDNQNPEAAADAGEMLRIAGVDNLTQAPKRRTVVNQQGQQMTVEEPAGAVSPSAAFDMENRTKFLAESRKVDADLVGAAGGLSGWGPSAMKLYDIGGTDNATALSQFARETVANEDPANKAIAWKSTVDMLGRVVGQLNPGRDPMMTRVITDTLKSTRDALGAQGFSMKEAPVVGAIKKALDVNTVAMSATGNPVAPERLSVIASAYAKRNSRAFDKMSPDERTIVEAEDRVSTLKQGLTLGANPALQSGSDVFTRTEAGGQAAIAKQPGIGGVDVSHTAAKSFFDEALDTSAALVAATPGLAFEDAFKDTMAEQFSGRILQTFGGKTPAFSKTYSDPVSAENAAKAPGAKTETLPDGTIRVTTPGAIVNRDMAKGIARLSAAVLMSKGSFNVNDFAGEIMSIPDVAEEIGRETAEAARASLTNKKETPALKRIADTAEATMASSFGKSFVKELRGSVTGDYWDMKPGIGVWNKATELAKNRLKADAADAWTAGFSEEKGGAKSDAFRYLTENVDGVNELRQIVNSEPGKSKAAEEAINAFVSQARAGMQGDFFSSPEAEAKLREAGATYVKEQAARLITRFAENALAQEGVSERGGLRMLLGKQYANWDTERDQYAPMQETTPSGPLMPTMKKKETTDFTDVLSEIVVSELAGAGKAAFKNSDSLYSALMQGIVTRVGRGKPLAAQQAPTPTTLQGGDLMEHIDMEKTSVADVFSAAVMLDKKNDEAVNYKTKQINIIKMSEKFGPMAPVMQDALEEVYRQNPDASKKTLMEAFAKTQKEIVETLAKQKLEEQKLSLQQKQAINNNAGFTAAPVDDTVDPATTTR